MPLVERDRLDRSYFEAGRLFAIFHGTTVFQVE
jgi:hypothetical protein